MQNLELQVERLENALTLGHLATLPKRNKDHFISTFTQEQQLFFQQYLYEGQRVARSWDDSRQMSPPIINPPASPKSDPEFQVGFGTPVLRARLDLISTRIGRPNGPIGRDRNQIAGGQEGSNGNETQPGRHANIPDAAKQDFKLNAESQKKNVSRADKKRLKEHNLPSDSDIELVERRAERRQRKKTKRNIINPDVSGDSDNQEKPSTTRKTYEQTKRQSKLRRDFALMHSFSSTNVGKNRLTLNPGCLDIGVFQKGKASEKTDVIKTGKHKRQESSFRFSEATFLNKPRQKVSKIDVEKMAKISTTREEDSTVISSASGFIERTDSEMKVKLREFKDKAPSKSNLVSKTKPQIQDKAQTGYNPADSVVWDIEQVELLSSEVSSGVKQGTIVLELPSASNKVPGNETLDTNIATFVESSQQKSLSVTNFDAISSLSLGPSQSASQVGLKTVDVVSLPTVPSKYFKSLPPRLAEPDLGLTHSTIDQLETNPSALSELGGLSTIKETVLQMHEPASYLHHSAGLSCYDNCEGGPDPVSFMQPRYDLVCYEGYPDSELWSPVDRHGGSSTKLLDNIDNIVDQVSESFDSQTIPNVVIPADEVWALGYTARRELGEMDQIHDTSFTPLSGHQGTELHNFIPASMWLSDTHSDISERCQGMAYWYSGRDSLSSIDLGSEDQQMPDGDFNLEHEGVSSMDLEIYPDVHHFWQGPSLLYGLSTPGNSSSLHKLSNVEADVARQLQLDHWQPQKL